MTKISHLNDIERTQIIMERERDEKILSTIATRRRCAHATVRIYVVLLPQYRRNNWGKIIFFVPMLFPMSKNKIRIK